jgi:hypothetical protein
MAEAGSSPFTGLLLCQFAVTARDRYSQNINDPNTLGNCGPPL